MRVLSLVICVVVLATSVVGCERPPATSTSSALARVRAAGVLRWGADKQGGEPYVSEDPDLPGKIVGFEAELAAAIAAELGVRAELVQNDWSNLVPSLERGTFDVAMNGLEVTGARRARIAFSRPYYVFTEKLVVRKDGPSLEPRLEALRGKKIGTLASSLGFELLRDHAELVLYEGVLEPYEDLAHGRLDGVLLDDVIADRYGLARADLRAAGDLAEGTYAIGLRREDTDLRAAIDDALGRLLARGDLARILERHGIWNERQTRLATLPSSVPDTAPGPAPHVGRATLLLFLRGAGVTLLVSTLAMSLAVMLGLGLALARLYGSPLVASLAAAYVEVYRGTPVLLQLYLLYYGLAGFLRLDPFSAAVIGLGMNYAAYEAEVYRAGIRAVPPSQMEAALCLGMTTPLALRRVVLPQALRHALPNVTNDFVALLKDSSLVSVITVVELTKQATITAVDVRGWLVPGAMCAALYFAMSYPLGLLARRLERRLEGEAPEAA